MTTKRTKELIEYRIEFINTKLGTNYKTDYVSHYGGWNLYEVLPSGGHSRGFIGFDERKSNAEMLNYVDGIYNMLCFYKVELQR